MKKRSTRTAPAWLGPNTTFAAIDFEIANPHYSSACAVGLVVVAQGQIANRTYRLIRPPTDRFLFSHIHGLSWAQVAAAPTFDEVWHGLAPLLAGSAFLAAHNAPFDRKVLRACCRHYEIGPPSLRFRCTVKLARRRWGIVPTTLPHVARHLGLPLRHHNAESDAEVCARIVLAASAP